MNTTPSCLRWRHAACILATATLAGLSACGGGGSSSPDAAPATPSAPAPATPAASAASLVEGTITGFGSVIIDGQTFKDTGAAVAIANNPEASTQATLGDLRTGMRVQAELKDGVLRNVAVNFALVGTLSAVDSAAASLTVFGQTIKTLSGGQMPTVFEGFTALSQLAVGDLLKVSGTVAGDGSITATRIERRVKDGSEIYRLSGAVQGLDSANKRFSLTGNSSVTVDYSNAKLLPTGALIENGKLVSVVAKTAPVAAGAGTVLAASAVEVRSKKLPDTPDLSIGGRISDFQSLASLRIGDVQVDASAATLKDGTVAADVVNGAQAYAQGALSAGVLKASSLKVFKSETAVKAQLTGQVTSFVSLSNFTLRDTVVDASGATFSKGKASDIATGTWLKLSGQLTSSGVLAKEIEVQAPPANKAAKLEGAISGLDLAAKKFTLLGVTVQWTEATQFSLEGGLTLATLSNGLVLSVEGVFDAASNVFTVSSVKGTAAKPNAGGTRTVGFSGIVFDASSTGFKVGSNSVLIASTTQLQPAGTTLADLKNGAKVSVKATLATVDGKPVLTALSIEVQKPEKDAAGNDVLVLAGLVTDYVSSSLFMLAGQKVDASGSTVEFIDGDASKLGNGAKLEVKGVLKDGVLVARRVHFMPG